jgi:hypothetical protein
MPVSTQAPEQLGKPGSQVTLHSPATQAALPLAGVSQTFPQTPQFSGSLRVSTQRPSQVDSAQSIVHSPPSQAAAPSSLAKQLAPHAPQLLIDELKLTHVPPQLVLSASQASVHAPLEQTLPRLQRAPHAPQCSGSLLISAQASPQGTRSVIG